LRAVAHDVLPPPAITTRIASINALAGDQQRSSGMMDHPDQSHPMLSRRRFLTTTAAGAATVAGAAPLVAARTAGRALASPARATTTLTVMYVSGELTPAYIKQFEQMNPDIKIRFLNDDSTTFNSMLAAGRPPDVYRSSGFGSASFNIQDVNVNLEPYLARSTVLKESDLAPVNDLYRWDGKQQGKGPLYGLVKDWSLDFTIWYNKKLLQAAGFKGPGENESLSFDEMLTMAKKLTVRKNGQVVVYGLDLAWGWSQHYPLLMAMAQSAGTSLYSADLKTANFTSPEILKALQWLVDYTKAQVGTSPLLTDANSPTGPFVAGRSALTTVGYWFGQQIQADPHHLSDYLINAPAPHWAGSRISPCIAGIGMAITSKSQNKDAAWKLMEYFMAGQPATDRVTSGWGLNSLKHLQSMLPQKTAFDQERLRVTLNDMKYFKPLKITPYASFASVATAISTAISSVARGNASLGSAAQRLESTVNRLIQQGLEQM
jgi:multiple sugar transport system substrate-binding protein